MESKEIRCITSGIKHWGLSGYSSILPRIKFCVTGQESSPQSPTISYRQPLCGILRRQKIDNKTRQQWHTETKRICALTVIMTFIIST